MGTNEGFFDLPPRRVAVVLIDLRFDQPERAIESSDTILARWRDHTPA